MPDGRGMNPEDYATDEAAGKLADLAGGKVVVDGDKQNFNTTHTAWAIEVNGTQENAGRILSVFANDAGYASAAIKSVEMCKLLGIPEDRTFADRLYTAFGFPE
jgi:hypothetical protein